MKPDESILHARDSELAILGCALSGSEDAGDVLAEVPASNIESDDVRLGLEIIRGLIDAGKPVEIGSYTAEHQRKTGKPADFETISKARELATSIGNLSYWAQEIEDAAMRRRMRAAAYTFGARATDASQTPSESIGELEGMLDTQNSQTPRVEPAKAVAARFLDQFDSRMKRQGKLSGIPTGFRRLDSLLDGFQLGEMTVIGARPSIGKTAFGGYVVDSACLKAQVPTLFITLEMSSAAIARRMFSVSGGIRATNLKRGTPTEGELKAMVSVAGRISKAPLHFLDVPSGTPHPIITAAIRRHVRKHGVKLVIIDYLQMIGAVGNYEKRTYAVGEVSTALKAVAKGAGVALLVLAQLSRESEKGESRKPRLTDLGDSKQIEQDADCVILLHRDRMEIEGEAFLIVAKQRDGETDAVKCRYNGTYLRFDEGQIDD